MPYEKPAVPSHHTGLRGQPVCSGFKMQGQTNNTNAACEGGKLNASRHLNQIRRILQFIQKQIYDVHCKLYTLQYSYAYGYNVSASII